MADLQEVLNEIDQKVPAQPVDKIKASDTNETLKAIASFAGERAPVITDSEKIIIVNNASSFTIENWQAEYAAKFGNRVLVQLTYEDTDGYDPSPGALPSMIGIPGVQPYYRRDAQGNTTSVYLNWGSVYSKVEIILGT